MLSRRSAWAISKVLWFVRYRGTENVPRKDAGAFILAANHQTYIDPGWICAPVRHKLRFMAFDAAFEWPVVGPLISYLGAFPVSLEFGGTLKAMKQALRALKDGAALVVFPEGEREFADGQMLDFKEGVVRLALQAKVPILPTTISGGNKVWPQGQKYPRFFRRVTITYHPLIRVNSEDELEAANQKLRDTIASAL